jgi:hypothetical protein
MHFHLATMLAALALTPWNVGEEKRQFLCIVAIPKEKSVLVLMRRVFAKFLDQTLLLETCSGCDQIHNCLRYDFGNTMLCYLSLA